MQKPKKKIQTILLGTFIVMIIIFINSNLFGTGGEKGNKEEDSREYVALEKALMQIEGVGNVVLYFHYEHVEKENALSDYFSLSTPSAKRADNLLGVLVVAEGAKDLRIRNKLSKILSDVLQLPEHRIAIEEMKKEGEQ
jgi:stage III sporulation protein AG